MSCLLQGGEHAIHTNSTRHYLACSGSTLLVGHFQRDAIPLSEAAAPDVIPGTLHHSSTPPGRRSQRARVCGSSRGGICSGTDLRSDMPLKSVVICQLENLGQGGKQEKRMSKGKTCDKALEQLSHMTSPSPGAKFQDVNFRDIRRGRDKLTSIISPIDARAKRKS